jgi:hypothetical protein
MFAVLMLVLSVAQERISLLTLQETKLEDCDDALITNLCGLGFDFYHLPV